MPASSTCNVSQIQPGPQSRHSLQTHKFIRLQNGRQAYCISCISRVPCNCLYHCKSSKIYVFSRKRCQSYNLMTFGPICLQCVVHYMHLHVCCIWPIRKFLQWINCIIMSVKRTQTCQSMSKNQWLMKHIVRTQG